MPTDACLYAYERGNRKPPLRPDPDKKP